MSKTHPLSNYIPFKLDFEQQNDILCRWLYLGDKKFIEPFFQETTSKCKAFEENRKSFTSVSTLDGMDQFAQTISCIAPTAFIFHVSRCGSTLLAQLLSLDEQNIVVAEPPIFDAILREIAFYDKNINQNKIDDYTKAIINFLGQIRTQNEHNLFIKLDSWHIFYYQKLRELYPNTPFVFSYRRPDEIIRSQMKQPGMHAAPGVIQPELFGFNLTEILALDRSVYIAKVLEKYFEMYLNIFETDKNTLFINYADGIMNGIEKIEIFLNLKIDLETKAKMVVRTQFHSKNQTAIFEEPKLENAIPEHQKKVFEMYEKLNQY